MSLLSLKINGTEIVPPRESGGISLPSGISLGDLISFLISLFISIGIIIALFYIAYGGWLWINSEGDKAKVEKARMTIIYTFVGLVVLSLSFVAINVVGQVLGINFFTFK